MNERTRDKVIDILLITLIVVLAPYPIWHTDMVSFLWSWVGGTAPINYTLLLLGLAVPVAYWFFIIRPREKREREEKEYRQRLKQANMSRQIKSENTSLLGPHGEEREQGHGMLPRRKDDD